MLQIILKNTNLEEIEGIINKLIEYTKHNGYSTLSTLKRFIDESPNKIEAFSLNYNYNLTRYSKEEWSNDLGWRYNYKNPMDIGQLNHYMIERFFSKNFKNAHRIILPNPQKLTNNKENNDMNKDELFEVFKDMFPNWVDKVVDYRKIGSRVLAITFKIEGGNNTTGEVSRVFLYVSPENWQFGTKLWRKRPERLTNKKEDDQND